MKKMHPFFVLSFLGLTLTSLYNSPTHRFGTRDLASEEKPKLSDDEKISLLAEKLCDQQSLLSRLEEKLNELLEEPKQVVLHIDSPVVPLPTQMTELSGPNYNDFFNMLRDSYATSSYFSMQNSNAQNIPYYYASSPYQNYLSQQQYIFDQPTIDDTLNRHPATAPLTFDFTTSEPSEVAQRSSIPVIPNYSRSRADTSDSTEFYDFGP